MKKSVLKLIPECIEGVPPSPSQGFEALRNEDLKKNLIPFSCLTDDSQASIRKYLLTATNFKPSAGASYTVYIYDPDLTEIYGITFPDIP